MLCAFSPWCGPSQKICMKDRLLWPVSLEKKDVTEYNSLVLLPCETCALCFHHNNQGEVLDIQY